GCCRERAVMAFFSIMRPKARSNALIVETLPDETLVYDERAHKIHCLNSTAALVWQHCDGEKTAAEIARDLATDEDVISATLDQLSKAKLLEVAVHRADGRKISRRELGRRAAAAGVAFVAIPAVLTLGIPTAANAASCLPLNSTCTQSSQCCSNCCKNVGGGINQCKPGGGACLP